VDRKDGMARALARPSVDRDDGTATLRERELFGFPATGDPYWTDQTLADVQCRYPRMDMTPYSVGARVEDPHRDGARLGA
jgi:hypothetical protein